MKGGIIAAIVTGSIILIAGIAVLTIGVVNTISNNRVVINSYDITESFTDFKVDLSVSNLKFEKSEDSTIKVVCEEREKDFHEVVVKDNALTITNVNNRKWFERLFMFDFKERVVTVYLPEGNYGDLKINSQVGNIDIQGNYTFANADVEVTTGNLKFAADVTGNTVLKSTVGNIKVTGLNTASLIMNSTTGNLNMTDINVTGDAKINATVGNIKATGFKSANLNVGSSTGNIELVNALVTNHVDAKASTGDIRLIDCDADSLKIKTSTGNVTGVLLTSKIFYASSNTGRVNVPHSTTGGTCEIETSTGNIYMSIKE